MLQGLAKLVDAHTVEVAGRRVTADKILIAVGGWPARPPPAPGIRPGRLEPASPPARAHWGDSESWSFFFFEVRRSFIITTVRDESQVTPQGRHR